MTGRIACAVFLLCPLASGCGGLFKTGTCNVYTETMIVRDECYEKLRYACLAREAWERVRTHCPTQKYSADYEHGFRSGFVDYLFAGGCGEPPALPPKRYRQFRAESAGGVQGLQDWYAGFRHGAGVAKESGLRQFVLVMPPTPPSPTPPIPLTGPMLEETSQQEPLPAPRPLSAESSGEAKDAIPKEKSNGGLELPESSGASSSPSEANEQSAGNTEQKREQEEPATEKPAHEGQP